MSFAHVKKHWVKYYFGVGAVWAAYNMYMYANQRNVMSGVKLVALWPLDVYQTVTGQTAAPAATAAAAATP